MPLTGHAARSLRALAHDLSPVVHVGKHGVTDELCAAVARALLDHELIKVKVLPEAPASPDEVAADVASRTASDVAQRIGRIVVLYKPHPKKPRIPVPKGWTKPAAAPKPTPAPAADEPGDDETLEDDG